MTKSGFDFQTMIYLELVTVSGLVGTTQADATKPCIC